MIYFNHTIDLFITFFGFFLLNFLHSRGRHPHEIFRFIHHVPLAVMHKEVLNFTRIFRYTTTKWYPIPYDGETKGCKRQYHIQCMWSPMSYRKGFAFLYPQMSWVFLNTAIKVIPRVFNFGREIRSFLKNYQPGSKILPRTS